MQSFSALNKQKLPFIFGLISTILIACVLLVLLVAWLVNVDFPGVEGTAIIILMAGIPMPAFLLTIGYVSWLLDRRIRVKALEKTPFHKLHQIGFVSTLIGADAQFSFTEETLSTNILGYNIQFDVHRDAPKKVEFLVFVQDAELNKEKYKRLEAMFKKENVFFDFEGVVKKYDLRKISALTIEKVEKELTLLIEQLKAEGFEPRTN